MKKKVLLVSMPFGALERQALGLSLLKARLVQEGVDCSIRYLTFPFAELIGGEEYCYISTDLPHTAFVGEWIFTAALYGQNAHEERRYIREVLENTWQLDDESIGRIMRARSMVPHFIDHCMATVEWKDYSLVGFTSTFEQNIASLAMAKRIKERYPGVKIVFGGGNWEGQMGRELHRQFRFVDYVCVGEADDSFPALVKYLFTSNKEVKSRAMPTGIIYRRNARTNYTGRSKLICNIDRLPIPDYSDYFHELGQSSVGSFVVPTLLFESSRGCWWGGKKQCTFCGLNGSTLTFRAKSAERVLRELKYLIEQWGIDMVQAVDNVVNMKYFKDFFPALAQDSQSVQLFYEVRASLTREHVKLLRAAGVNHVQPGIESMSDHVLRLMRKGTTALQNIQFLKWCREYGVRTDWNLLYGFPGENRKDYSIETMNLLWPIRFLNPPTACGPIRLDRFSPYYKFSGKFGLTQVRPTVSYKYLYPFGRRSLEKIAYYFDYDYEPKVDPSGYADEVIKYVEEWQLHPEKGTLESVERMDGKLGLVDTRSDAVRSQVMLSGLDREVYEFCDRVRSFESVVKHLRRTFSDREIKESQVYKFLQSLLLNKLMVKNKESYLSLAIRAHPAKKSIA